MDQFKFDVLQFSDLLSKFTGISKAKIDNYLANNPVNCIFEHPTCLDITKAQHNKILELKELKNLYNTLKLSADKQYIINSSVKASEYFKAYFNGIKDKERFVCTFLDNSNRIIATKILNIGTVNESPVYPREIVKEAIMHDANTVILSHNHPGESTKPSVPDIDVTKKIVQALDTVKIKVLDHIIVGGDSSFSFTEMGMMNSFGDKVLEDHSVFESQEQTRKLERISEIYQNEYPAIKYITEKTAAHIDGMNINKGSVISIENIFSYYKELGKLIENSEYLKESSSDDLTKREFQAVQQIVQDLKHAQLLYKQEIAQQRSAEAGICKANSFELTR